MVVRFSFFAILFSQLCLVRDCASPHAGAAEADRNHLATADSPYLREHADNPVCWYEWGPEALDKARRENKPLIISIGYASCHWCHVMEQESFMDTTVARFMNQNFVAVKVDREQRPDIDQIYLTAAQLISGHAGWPLNAFALPDGRPVYAGTYYPKDEWMAMLHEVIRAYKNNKPALLKRAEAITKGVRTSELITAPADTLARISRDSYEKTFDSWKPQLDFIHGGLKGAPKFPMPANMEFLLQYHALTGNKDARDFVLLTLDQMAAGGIYDAVGGGFYRYATDSLWRIPHFEKMLYDNAQLISLYAHAFRLTRKPLYRRIIEESFSFVERELANADGAFYSSLNADSEGQEGKFYSWTSDEITEAGGEDDGALLARYYNITPRGNWEAGKNVLFTTTTPEDFARSIGLSEEAWTHALQRGRDALMAFRNKRVRPTTDDKVLTSWNALMITACIDAYTATADELYLETALRDGRFIETKMMRDDGHLWRNYRNGAATIDAFLDDYALLAQAFINLYQATFDIHWLQQARTLTHYALDHFTDPVSHMLFYTSDAGEALITRKMEISDNVIPSSNSTFAAVLFQLGEYFQDPAFGGQSRSMLKQVSAELNGAQSIYYGNWARVAGMWAYPSCEVAVTGENASAVSLQLQNRKFIPLALFCGGNQENLPLLENKYVAGQTVIYICQNRECRLPVTELNEALKLLP